VRRLAVLVAALAAAICAAAAPGRADDAVTWCGPGESAVDRRPDAVPALEFHVVYAYPSDGADRFAELAGPIATDLAAIDAWWRAQDPGRTPRFDLAGFPGCASTFGRLDLSAVRLAHAAAWYFPASERFDRLRHDLDRTFADPDKKELVYYDGPVEDTGLCGEAPSDVSGGGPFAYAAVYLGSRCGDAVGRAASAALVTAHELIHSLGALPAPVDGRGPPHACPDDPSHVCDSAADVLYPTVESGGLLSAAQLDVGRDDYYGHSGPWWDVRDSPFLDRLEGRDRSPPAGLAGLDATGDAAGVHLSWAPSSDDTGPVRYEVYRDGSPLALQSGTRFDDPGARGAVAHAYRVRALDAAGRLGAGATIRFAPGLGVVDAAGRLLRDTVAPTAVTGLVARRTAACALVLGWRPAHDRGGLRGYRVLRNGTLYRLARVRTLTVPSRLAAATWGVRAVDLAGNLGEADRLTVRRPTSARR
jgi:hypothetical protein